ncbi:MAG TPA: transglycosylase SLT domain-containing protein [Salinimicrobium sp.]|nr:transglycosylase SLT domain-containing protein [Salinimicrobium sp.]
MIIEEEMAKERFGMRINFSILLLFLSVVGFSQENQNTKDHNEPKGKYFLVDTIKISDRAPLLLNGDDVEFANKVADEAFIKDSIVITLLDHPGAAEIDSLWQIELLKSSLYQDYRKKLLNEEYDEVAIEELPTDTLKKRLKALDSRTPFKIEYNPFLERVISSYLTRNKKAIEHLMALSSFYFPLFEEKLDKYNVPLEIKYLAIVESSLNPRARSRVGATGLWQFMYSTGKMHGLEVSSYVDERMNPVKATDAAARYLSTLFRVFEDWDLVLASYNSGPGNVSKAIRRSGGSTDYWKLRPYLPRETANYVPAFIAIMYVFEYAEEHGFQPPVRTITYFETDTVQIRREITFDEISKITKVDKKLIQFLNPSFKLDVIPDIKSEDYSLRLPRKKIGPFVANEEAIYNYVEVSRQKEVKEERNSGAENRIRYEVSKGDYLGKIAEQFGVGISEIKKWNNLRNNRLSIGQDLILYASSDNGGSSQNGIPDVYTVRKGDSLWSITKKFPGLTIKQLKTWNNMKNSRLKPGMELKLSQG